MATRRALTQPSRVPFPRVHGNAELRRLQNNLEDATADARANPENRARTVDVRVRPPDSGIPGDPGQPPSWPMVSVAHTLGRKPIGWKIVSRVGQTTGTQLRDRVGHNTRFLNLEATGTDGDPVTVFTLSVW